MASSGRGSRTKGSAAERALVRTFLDAGIVAEKVSRSGYGGHDVEVALNGIKLRVESKNHSDGFKRIYEWLAPVDLLVLKANHQESLVVLPLSRLIALLGAQK